MTFFSAPVMGRVDAASLPIDATVMFAPHYFCIVCFGEIHTVASQSQAHLIEIPNRPSALEDMHGPRHIAGAIYLLASSLGGGTIKDRNRHVDGGNMGRSSRFPMFFVGFGLLSSSASAATLPAWTTMPSARFAHEVASHHRFGQGERDQGFDSIVAGVGPIVAGEVTPPAPHYGVGPLPVRVQGPCIRPLVIVIDQDSRPVAKPRVLYGVPPCGAGR